MGQKTSDYGEKIISSVSYSPPKVKSTKRCKKKRKDMKGPKVILTDKKRNKKISTTSESISKGKNQCSL